MAKIPMILVVGMALVLLASAASAGTFRGHNHFGDRGSGTYGDGVISGVTNGGKTISGTYGGGFASGTVGRYTFSANYGSGVFSGTVFGYQYPFFHGVYFN